MSEKLKNEIFNLVKEYYKLNHKSNSGVSDYIPYAKRIFDEEELINLIDSSLEFWLTQGRYTKEFEKDFQKFLGIKYCSLTNSGSSANLLAFMALTSPILKERQIKKGDEIITVAAGFPTTISPIINYGCIPVFLDINIPNYNIDTSLLNNALSDKTKAVFIAHTLGNPFDIKTIKEFCLKYNLWLIEDNCDSLGSKYFLNNEHKYTGTFGDISTSSFYPPHHITMGEGGAVYTDNFVLKKILDSFRDWGRDCHCPPGKDNTCKQRFSNQFGELPIGYDHKYVYSHFGYNLKLTDMQASIGVAQLKKLPDFILKRQNNWNLLNNLLNNCSDQLILPVSEPNSIPSWFGYLITLNQNCKFTRNEIVIFLEKNNIQTRNLFAGNIIKHPCFDEMRKTNTGYRIVGNLDNTDYIMENSFWVGVYPGLSDDNINFIAKKIKEFIKK